MLVHALLIHAPTISFCEVEVRVFLTKKGAESALAAYCREHDTKLRDNEDDEEVIDAYFREHEREFAEIVEATIEAN